MRHIYYEKRAIPIPPGAHLHRHNGVVDVFIFQPKPGEPLSNTTKRLNIGRAVDDTTMYPNDNYKEMYPQLWQKYYGETEVRKEYQLSAGMYELMLGIGYTTGLYPLLQKNFGPLYANMFMDLALFTNQRKTDAMITFHEALRTQVIFSKDRVDDNWISDFLCKKVSESDCMYFMDMWIEECKKHGVKEVWISVDGSNSDCNATECSLAEPGHPKTKKSGTDIISYVYIVDAETGLPLGMVVVNGGMVDSKSFFDAIHLVKNHDLNIKGILIDRGYCGEDVINAAEQLNYPYVLMLKSNTFGHVEMYNEYSEKIRWNIDHWVESPSGTLFGLTSESKRKLFKHSDKMAFINLFFDGQNSAERSSTLIKKIMSAKKSIEKALANGREPVLTSTMSRYIELKTDNEGNVAPCYKFENWREEIKSKGFYSVATSENYGASEANRLYKLRNCSEITYSENKSQLGFTVPRNHKEKGVLSKLFVGFISSIIRHYIMTACIDLELDTNSMVLEMDRIHIRLNSLSGDYMPIHDESSRHLALLKKFSVKPEDLDGIASDVNSRFDGPTDQIRKLNSWESILAKEIEEKEKKEKLQQKKLENEQTTKDETSIVDTDVKVKKSPGRPKGSKNKATLEREAKIAAGKIKPKEKKKPGRPKGSRNKVNVLLTLKYRKGRPPGSKNKKTLEKEERERQLALQAASQAPASPQPTMGTETPIVKNKGGRPLGSKDKHPSGNRKGRVKGSRNKSTKARDELRIKASKLFDEGKS